MYNGFIYIDKHNSTYDLTCVNGDVRLVGGTSNADGRVEMCYNRFWGPVCHSSWSTTDANVVCGQLGYQRKGTVRIRTCTCSLL